ncbi:hypothetical protein NHH03_09415 [Stieleria sp. TO1_6]|uniref:hypothetical protein n=1 Tax=Stieleria tagensis TaxID=2956795 RepID=UPI00209BAF41|nr:hypothetical protein [Stieleria tagensis]MCO8121953.1 hypothetical protein [Stieleria tagensis]
MRCLLTCVALLVAPLSLTVHGQGSSDVVKQWVSQNSAGRISGRVVLPYDGPAGQIAVSLAGTDGAIYGATPSPTSPAEFSFEGIPAGTYAVVARGEDIFACYALNILPPSPDPMAPGTHYVDLRAAFLDICSVKSAALRYLPNSPPAVAAPAAATPDAANEALNESVSPQIPQSGGGFSGQINRAGLSSGGGAGLANVLIYQDDVLVAQTVTANDGTFKIDTLAPGDYSLVAAGPDGLAITSFNLVNELMSGSPVAANNAAETGNGVRLIALQGGGSGMGLQLAPVGLSSPVVQELILSDNNGSAPGPGPGLPAGPGMLADPLASPGMGGGFGGGGYGGGGGGGGGIGGGGLGGLAALGAAGIGIAAIVSDDDDSLDLPPVVSPVAP